MISFLNKKKNNNNVIEYPHYVIVVRDEIFWVVRSVKSKLSFAPNNINFTLKLKKKRFSFKKSNTIYLPSQTDMTINENIRKIYGISIPNTRHDDCIGFIIRDNPLALKEFKSYLKKQYNIAYNRYVYSLKYPHISFHDPKRQQDQINLIVKLYNKTIHWIQQIKSNNPNYDYYNSRRVSLF